MTIAEAKILAKLLPIRIDASNTSGLCSNLSALMAPLEPLERFLNLTLFDAIIPVSDPDEKAEKIRSTNNAKNKKEIELVLKEKLQILKQLMNKLLRLQWTAYKHKLIHHYNK